VEEQDVPPGFEKNAAKEAGAADLAKAVEEKAVVQTPEDDVDEPDPSLKTPGLREQAAEVQVSAGRPRGPPPRTRARRAPHAPRRPSPEPRPPVDRR